MIGFFNVFSVIQQVRQLYFSHESGSDGLTGPLLIGTTLGLIIETELASGIQFLAWHKIIREFKNFIFIFELFELFLSSFTRVFVVLCSLNVWWPMPLFISNYLF